MFKKIAETEIPVPWGHVAAKMWGDEKDPFVLVPHGTMDNAGSFDRLIPILPSSFYYVCIDLPGHGKSSHWPPFFPVYIINNILVYKLILKHFEREKCIILGHSIGGQIAFLFAQMYPDVVEKLILLDAFHLLPIHRNLFIDTLRDKLEFCLNLNEKMKRKTQPTYTYEEALKKLMTSRNHGTMNAEAAIPLLQRSLMEVENGKFVFTIDQKMKGYFSPIHDFQYIIETIRKFPIQCPVLMILARGFKIQKIYMKPVENELKKFRNFKIVKVDGNHDVHSTNPELVAPHINNFLLNLPTKL